MSTWTTYCAASWCRPFLFAYLVACAVTRYASRSRSSAWTTPCPIPNGGDEQRRHSADTLPTAASAAAAAPLMPPPQLNGRLGGELEKKESDARYKQGRDEAAFE